MKPIFEPGDFEIRFSDRAGQALIVRGSSHGSIETLSSEFGEQVAQQANAKLQALGIDAETPERVRQIRQWEAEADVAKERASINGMHADNARKRLAELEIHLKNREWYIDKIEPRLKELEQTLREERIQNKTLREEVDEFERMIADAPVFYELSEARGIWFSTPRRRDYGEAVRSAKLIQIEEIAK